MAKEIVIWCECDLELDDRRVPASEHEMTLNGKAYTIDLCDECYAKHVAPLAALLDQFGQPVVAKRGPYKKSKPAPAVPRSDGAFVCDEPGCGREFASAQGLGRHRTSHAPK